MDTTEKNELAQEFVNATLEFAKIVRPMCEIIGVDVVTMMAQDSLSQAIAKNAVSRIIEGDDEDAIDQVNELILQCSPPAEEIAALYEDMFLTMTPDEIL